MKARCHECPLAKAGTPFHTPVRGDGDMSADIVLVGEAPGRNEVRSGKPFSGPTGQLLDAMLEDTGLPRASVFVTNSTACVPLDGSKVPPKAVECCRPRLEAEVKAVSPKLTITLGTAACKNVLQTNKGITQIEGALFDTPIGKVLPTYHPAAVLRGAYGKFDDIHDALRRAKLIVEDGYEAHQLNHNIPFVQCMNVGQNKAALKKLVEKSRSAQGDLRWALDLETDSVNFMRDPILQIGIYDGTDAYALNYQGRVRNMDGTFQERTLDAWDDECRALWLELSRNPWIEWVLHNQSFDFQFLLHNFGEYPVRSIDTMCLALGTTEQGDRVGLKKLARNWFNAPDYDKQLEKWFTAKNRKKRKFSDIPRDVLATYLAKDLLYTYELVPILDKIVEAEGTRALCYDYLMPYQREFTHMESVGCYVDQEYAKKLDRIWAPRIQEAADEIADIAEDHGFKASAVVKKPKTERLNPGSPKQLQHLLYNLMGFWPVKTQGRLTTGRDFLDRYPDEPITKKLEFYRTLKKMMSTYVTGIADLAWADGRIHPDILLYGTVTGRLAIKRPGLQTIPKPGRLRVEFDSLRKLFSVENHDEMCIVHIDYKQLEFRMGWHYSEDANMGEACMMEDFHTASAAKIFGVPYNEVTKAQRHRSKFVSFGIMYGRGAHSLAAGELNCSVEEAQEYINEFFRVYPDFHAWWMATQQQAFEQQWFSTTIGRKRRWNLITPKNQLDVRNQSVNFPLQSLASDLNTMSAVRMGPTLREKGWGNVMFPVHDALLFEMKKEHLHEAIPYIISIMETPPFPTCATFQVDVEVGPSWGELVDWDPDRPNWVPAPGQVQAK